MISHPFSNGAFGKPLLVDLNGNGLLDLVLQPRLNTVNPEFHLSKVLVALNDGKGGFKESQEFVTGDASSAFYGVFSMDLNGDGVPDLIVPGSGKSLFLQETQEVEFIPERISLATQAEAQEMLGLFDSALKNLTERIAHIGSSMNRLESAQSAIMITAENLEAAQSQILDTDMAQETAELARLQILQAASIAVLGQANSSLELVLRLLVDP